MPRAARRGPRRGRRVTSRARWPTRSRAPPARGDRRLPRVGRLDQRGVGARAGRRRARVRQDARRRRAGRVRHRGRRAALAGARPTRSRCPGCWRSATATGRASWRSSGSTRGASTRPARRRSGAGWPRCTPPGRPTSARRRPARRRRPTRSRRCASASSRCPTTPRADWPSFYAERRLAPLVALCLERGTLSASGARAVERVCERIGDLAGPAEPPARLHGDLWGGNVLAGADGRARLIDPAAYGGHREVDLAMLRLFGAPSERVFAAYDEAAPLADGHARARGALAAVPAARARRAVRRLLRRVRRARGRALRHVTAA